MGSLFNVRMPPELAYHAIQMVAFGAVAMLALRMKYLWTPYICVFASVCVFNASTWSHLIGYRKESDCKNGNGHQKVTYVTSVVGVLLISFYAQKVQHRISTDLNDLREFYDPDTVELMHWIRNNTQPGSSFSGSMQLLAAVKLSTGRPITNHPHFEDKLLRQKTKDLYKYYGRYTSEEVHRTLKKYQTDYIILEDSICLVPYRDGCGLPYIMDIELGLELDEQGYPLEDSQLPRFCDEVRTGAYEYGRLFKLVMSNKTFRIYRVEP